MSRNKLWFLRGYAYVTQKKKNTNNESKDVNYYYRKMQRTIKCLLVTDQNIIINCDY